MLQKNICAALIYVIISYIIIISSKELWVSVIYFLLFSFWHAPN